MKTKFIFHALSLSTLIALSHSAVAEIRAVFSTPYISIAFADQHRYRHQPHYSAHHNQHYKAHNNHRCNTANSDRRPHHVTYAEPTRLHYYKQGRHYGKQHKYKHGKNVHVKRKHHNSRQHAYQHPTEHRQHAKAQHPEQRKQHHEKQRHIRNTGWISSRY